MEEKKPEEARREFLQTAGRFAVGAPPLVTVLLSKNNVVAAYGGDGGEGGEGY